MWLFTKFLKFILYCSAMWLKKNNNNNEMLGKHISEQWFWSSATGLFKKLFLIKAPLIKSNCPAISQICWCLLMSVINFPFLHWNKRCSVALKELNSIAGNIICQFIWSIKHNLHTWIILQAFQRWMKKSSLVNKEHGFSHIQTSFF